MCESVPLLAAASNNRDGGHHHEGKKTTEMSTGTGDLDVPPQPTPETPGGSSTALPSPSPAPFVYYPDDFRYCYDDDSHLQDQEDDGGGADQQLDEGDDGADEHELLEDDAPPAEAERAPTTGLAAKVASFARRKASEVNMAGAVVAGLGLVVGAYFLWPAAAGAAAVAAAGTMKAPGGAGFLISRVAFQANPQLYFQILRTAGAAAAAAAFAL